MCGAANALVDAIQKNSTALRIFIRNQPGSFAGTCGSSADFGLPFTSEVFWNRTARYGLPESASRDFPVNEPGTGVAVISNGSIKVAEKFAVVGRGKS
jgi:hypothetical protein